MSLFDIIATRTGRKDGQGKNCPENRRDIKRRRKQIRREILRTLKGVKL